MNDDVTLGELARRIDRMETALTERVTAIEARYSRIGLLIAGAILTPLVSTAITILARKSP